MGDTAPEIELRVCKRKQPDGTFAEFPFRELKKGDVFQLFEATGEHVPDAPHELVAESDAYPPKSGEGAWGIQVAT